MKCLICDANFDLGKRLSDHIKKTHTMSSEVYTIKCLLGGVRPTCPSCGGQTRYVAFSFKRYCSDCKSVAAAVGGRKGGQAPAWNRGQTKETDQRVAKAAERVTGEGNPFFGRRHSFQSLQRMSASRRITPNQLSDRISSRSDGTLEEGAVVIPCRESDGAEAVLIGDVVLPFEWSQNATALMFEPVES